MSYFCVNLKNLLFQDSKDYDKMQNRVERMVSPDLKFVCGILGLEKKGDKNATIEKLIEYLMEPKDIERVSSSNQL